VETIDNVNRFFPPVTDTILQKCSNKDDEAWQHKERLLRYDRESAQRTVIIDDQADYYSSSAWLTAAEDEEARETGQIHYDEKHRRGRTTMKLNIG
jgi:hypothetical protein